MNNVKEEIESRLKCWPKDGFEILELCPVCSSKIREILYRDLEDYAFKCAPGEWDMYKCGTCGTAYLTPRPNQKTIGLAYKEYYTHQSTDRRYSYFNNLKLAIINGYRNMKFGVRYSPSSVLGVLYYIFPDRKKIIDSEARGLEEVDVCQSAKVLDVGCGNGEFLALASMMGCQAFGVEPDPRAVKAATDINVEILGSFIDDIPDRYNGYFDVITLSHVIEHVHEPIAMIEKCYDLLVDGGRLWIETPNIDSLGHEKFGKFWRGLEAPRHLTVFNWDTLYRLLDTTGFTEIQRETTRRSCKWMFKESSRLQGRALHENTLIGKIKLMWKWYWADLTTRFNVSRQEFITVNCIKYRKIHNN